MRPETKRRAVGWMAGGAVCAAVFCLVAAGGCRSDQKPIDMEPRSVTTPITTAEAIARIMNDQRRWSTMEARCKVMLRNLRIPRPNGQLDLGEGQLFISKPGRISVRVPGSGQLRAKLVGNGQSYTVDIPLLRTSYAGHYGEPVEPRPNDLIIMPEDIVDAFDMGNVFAGKIQMQVQNPGLSTIFNSVRGPGERPHLLMVNSVSFDRRTGNVLLYSKYNPNGTARVQMTLADYRPVQSTGEEAVDVPHSLLLVYSGTSAMLRLADVKLNTTMPDGIFEVR